MPLNINGTVSYSGGSNVSANGELTVSNGTLNVSGAATFLSDGGYIGYGAGTDGTVNITGAGSVWNSTTDLFIGYDAVGKLTISSGGAVNVNGGNSFVTLGDKVGTVGTLNIGAVSGVAAVAPGTISTAAIKFGPGTGTLQLNHTDAAYTFGSVLEGAGTVLNTAGVTTFSANSSAFTGTANVNGGTVLITNNFGASAVNVASGAILSGTGNISGAVSVSNGGILRQSAGSALSMGALALNATSAVNLTLGAPSATQLFNVSGNVTLDGLLSVTNGGGFDFGTYKLISYSGALTNNGLTINSLPAGFNPGDWSIATDATSVSLVIASGASRQYWDGAGTTANFTVDGGSGTWNAAATNWTNIGGDINAAWASERAVFAGVAGGVVTVEGALNITGLVFDTTGYVLAAGAGAAFNAVGSSDASVTVNGAAAQIDVAISGSNGLVKLGTGSLTMTGAHSYTGATTVETGSLLLSGAASIAASSGLDIKAGASLDLSGVTPAGLTINNFSGAGTLALGSKTLTFGTAASTAFSGTVSGTGSLVKQGSGTLTFTGSAANLGALTIGAGSVAISGGNAIGNSTQVDLAAGTSLTVAGGETIGALSGSGGAVALTSGVFTTSSALNTSYAGTIGGAGSFVKAGTGTLTLGGAVTAASTTLTQGTLHVNGGSITHAATNQTIGNTNAMSATLQVDSGSVTVRDAFLATVAGSTGSIQVGAGGTWTGRELRIGSVGNASISALGGGDFVTTNATVGFGSASVASALISGAGSTWTNADTLNVGRSSGGIGALTISDGASVTLDADQSVPYAAIVHANSSIHIGADSVSAAAAPGTLNLALLQLLGADASLNFKHTGSTTLSAGVLIEDNGSINHTAGTTLLTGAIESTTDTATIKLYGGSLELAGANNAFGGTTLVYGGVLKLTSGDALGNNMSDAQNLKIDGASTVEIGSGITIANGMVLSAAAILSVASGTGSISGLISGASSLSKAGAGTLVLGGANTYAGGTTVSAGTLEGTTTSLQGNVALVTGATLSFSQAGNGTYAGTLSGTGTVRWSGAGDLTLSAANTYAGTTQIGGGALVLGSATSAGSSDIAFSALGATTLRVGAFSLANKLTGFGTDDRIDLQAMTYANGAVGLGFSGGILTVTQGGTSATFDMQGLPADGVFSAAADGDGSTLVSFQFTPATVTSVNVPANATYKLGDQLTFTVNFSKAVTVTGTDSTLALTVGATARSADFLSSTATSASYRYTLQAGDLDADGIAVGAIALGTSTIRDANSINANLALAGAVPSMVGVLADAVAPAVSGQITVPANATYGNGAQLNFTITFDENIVLTGSDSTLGLSIGSTARSASLVASSANSLTYRYTVQAGEDDSDGIAVGALTLNTSTLRDAAGNNASLSLAGAVPSTAGVRVDSSGPAVNGFSVPANATYKAGDQLDFTVSFNETVSITSAASTTLGLTVGSGAKTAAYLSATATTVTYRYTVGAGDADADGITFGALALNGATIRDAASNNANLSLGAYAPANTGILIDAQPPGVAGNIAVPANGAYKQGAQLDFTVSFDENIVVTGTDSTLGLTIGGTARTAAFLSSTASAVTYRYTVQAGETDTDGIAVGAIALGTSTLRDAAGNNANVSLAGKIPSTAAVLVDTTAPAVSSVNVPTSGIYRAGQHLDVVVNFSEALAAGGAGSTLGLTIGNTVRSAAFLSSTGASATYRYTVQGGELDSDGITIGALTLGGGALRDAAGNDANLSLAGLVPSTAAVLVDAVAPYIAGVAVPANGAYTAGRLLTFTVTFSAPVTVAGSDSTLGLTIGSTARSAAFVGSSATTATYRYIVQPGETDTDGIAVGALALGSSTIRDSNGTAAILALNAVLPSTAGIRVDTTAPAVSSVAVPANGSYKPGDHLDVTVTFNETITLSGTGSKLSLTVGSAEKSATFLSSTANSLTYRYTVQAGDVDSDGIAVGPLTLAGNTSVADAAGNAANLALNGLPSTAGVLVDGRGPAISAIAVPVDGWYRAGAQLDFTVTFDEALVNAGGGSTLGLTVGSNARSAALISSSGNSLTYRYIVQEGDNDTDGIALGALSGSFKDALGNNATLALPSGTPSLAGVRADTTAPVLVAAAINGNSLVATFSDLGLLDAAMGPPGAAFTVRADGQLLEIGSLQIDGVARTVTLLLASAAKPGQLVTLAYTDPAIGDDLTAVQDQAGNDAASFAAFSVANQTAQPVVTSSAIVDGVLVTTVTTARSDGPSTRDITVPVVQAGRNDTGGPPDTADIALFPGQALSAGLPVGFGLAATGFVDPASIAVARQQLLQFIGATASPADRPALQAGAVAFTDSLPAGASLIVQSLRPVTAGNAPSQALTVRGADTPLTALVLDTRALTQGPLLQLDNVEFAAIVGNASVRAGNGAQHMVGDSANQVFRPGAGNDVVDGGGGRDVLELQGQGRADYIFRVQGGALQITQRKGEGDGSDSVAHIDAIDFMGAADMSARAIASRLHEGVRGTAPGDAAMQELLNALGSGKSYADIASQLLANDNSGRSDAQFVADLYQNVLARGGDAAGRDYWVSLLATGKLSRPDLMLVFANSPESLALEKNSAPAEDFNHSDVASLVRLYDSWFDRRPDEGGLNYWIGMSEGGSSLTQIAAAFLQSPETVARHGALNHQQFITALYQTALDRTASSVEVAYWAQQLDAGIARREDILLAFADSAEKIDLVGVITTTIDVL